MAILARLKELETANAQMAKALDDVRTESTVKDDKIKALSADKRKDMEQMIDTAIDTWLNSLTGISEDVRKQFRTGISRIAEQADMRNAAWEVVCQASTLHTTNVARIEELIKTCNDQTKTIESLVGTTTTTAAGVAGGFAPQDNGGGDGDGRNPKRQRTTADTGANNANKPINDDAWDLFSSMLKDNSRSVYF